jgi:hypothetical protein
MLYKFDTTISETGLISLPIAPNLRNKRVEIIIIPLVEKEKHRTTEERLIEFYGETGASAIQAGSPTDIDWGKPVGKEIW